MAAVHVDLFDQQADEFLRCSGVSVPRISSSWSAGPARAAESGGVCACGERLGEVGLQFAEGLKAATVATNAFLADRR